MTLTPIEIAIIEALALHPNGATAKELAAAMNRPSVNTSSRLGRLFFNGTLTRERTDSSMVLSTEYRYRIKPKPVAVPAPPSQWQPPEIRLAARREFA